MEHAYPADLARVVMERFDVASAPESLELWGLVQTGPGWLHAIQGGRARAAPLPASKACASYAIQ